MGEKWPKRPSSAARGYNYAHQQLRAQWAHKVGTGRVHCARCLELIPSDATWELGHDDQDRSRHTGPEHEKCNQDAGRRLGVERRGRLRRTPEKHPGITG